MIEDVTYDLLMEGYNYKEISDRIPYTQEFYFARVTKKLKDKGRITDKDIEEAKFNRFQKRRMEIVLQCLQRGFNYQETADFDKSLKLTKQQYRDCQDKLIGAGKITPEQIKAEKKLTDELRAAERAEEYEGPHDKEIIRLTKENLSSLKIASELGVGRSYVTARQRAIRKKQQNQKRGITKEQLENCLRQVHFSEEQIQRILDKDIQRIVQESSIYRINKILRILILYRISYNAIEKCLTVLVDSSLENIGNILRVLLDEYKINKQTVENCLIALTRGKEDEIREIFKILMEEHLIAKEKIEGCLTVLSRGKADNIRGIFEVLDKHRISKEAIENCLTVLASGNAEEIREIFGILDAHIISKRAIEGALSVIARGKADNVRKIFEALDELKIKTSKIEKCLSILVVGDAKEIKEIFKILLDNGIDRETISNNLYTIATGKSGKIDSIFEKFKSAKLDASIVLRRGLGMLVNGNADEVEKIILILQDNGVRKEIIEEELSAIVNGLTSEEVEAIFDDKEEPRDKDIHYINVRRYMKLKELYGRVYGKGEIEEICAQKHLSVREFILEVVTYPNAKSFADIYYEKVMSGGVLYVGGSTDIDRDYQEEHGEELIKLSRKVARKLAQNTGFKDYAELESKSLEIILNKCGNLVYNLSNNPDTLKAAIFNKTMKCMRSELQKIDMHTLSLTYAYGESNTDIRQRDIAIRDNVSEYYEDRESDSLEHKIDYEKAQFSKQETQVMKCMIKLVEEGESDNLAEKVARIIIIDEEELLLIMAGIREKMLQSRVVTVRADGKHVFTKADDDSFEL